MSALLQAIAAAVHLQEVNVVGESIEQGSGESLGVEDIGTHWHEFCAIFDDRPEQSR
jgi:hypothetical protein